MRCIFCKNKKTRVIEKRDSKDLLISRRRRECTKCGRRFTTYEKADLSNIYVRKKDGERELFDKDKIKESIRKAAKGRKISLSKISHLTDKIEIEILEKGKKDISTRYIARLVMKELKDLDNVTFVRYASHQYYLEDSKEFNELRKRIDKKRREDMIDYLD